MIINEIRGALQGWKDPGYRQLQITTIPTVPPQAIIGVRTPALRGYARQLAARADIAEFLDDLPHRYFEENQLHAFIIARTRDFDACVAAVERFLPHIDNWATCDQLSPAAFKAHRDALPVYIERWLRSNQTYTVRFGIGMLMAHYLDTDFDPACLKRVAAIRSDEYYVNMMIAWYFATALTNQYAAALPYIETRQLDAWTHNKAIQKAVESRRIPDERKAYLKTLRIPRRASRQ